MHVCLRRALAASASPVLLALALAWPHAARAQAVATPPPQGVVNLQATATVELPRDSMTLTFSTSRDGPDAATVQAQVRQALETALAEARKAARPQQIDVRTGAFSLMPRYAPKGGHISGWHGSAELTVEGRDMAGIAQLAGRIQTMSIARVAYGLTREAREQAEGTVTAQAIARFRAKAAEVARQFGYAGMEIREVQVSTEDAGGVPMPVMARMRAATDEAAAAPPLPVEAGRGSVTAVVSGSVQMTR